MHRPAPLGEKPWKLVLAFGFFAVPFVGLLVGIVVGAVPLASMGGVLMLLSGGFCVAGLGLLPVVRRVRSRVHGPNALMWVFFFSGIALWCAAPIVALAGGAGWGTAIGGSGRALPVWALAILTWGTAGLMLYAFVWQRVRGRPRD